MSIRFSTGFVRILPLGVLMVPLAAHAGTGFYIGASAGGATIDSNLDGVNIPGLPSDIDEDDTATKIFAGYTVDLPLLDVAVEAGYVDFGEPDIDVLGQELTLDTTGFNVWGIATFNAGLIDIYGKLGLIAWEVDAKLLNDSASEDGTDLGYGIGAAFGLGPLEIRGEYELYDLDDADVSMLSVGLVYRF